MERRKSQDITDITLRFLREMGLETPLLQYRILQAWPNIVGENYSHRTKALEIRNQVLYVAADSPSLCAFLAMHRTSLVARLNQYVGAFIITDIKFQPTFNLRR